MTSELRNSISIAMLVVAIVLYSACKPKPDFSKQVSTLDSLRVSIISVYDSTMVLKAEEFNTNKDSVAKNLVSIQFLYKGTMNESMARVLSSYNLTSKSVADPQVVFTNLDKDFNQSRLQIENLMSALNSNATQDALGNEITDIYVSEAIKNEKRAVEQWSNNWRVASEALKKSLHDYNELQPQIKLWVDSLNKVQ
jgi:predicted transcriptional regulator